MKKLMISLATVIMAVACNAAAVAWNSGAVYKTDASAKVGKGATDYLVSVAFFLDAAGEKAVTGLTGDFSSSTAGTGSKYSGVVDGFTGGSTYYAQMIITTSGYEAKSDIVDFVAGTVGNTSLNFATGEGFSTVAPVLDTSKAGTWAAVPEPTSGLLMLLGLAGLALKRKRA